MLHEAIACSHLRTLSLRSAVEDDAFKGTPREGPPIESVTYAACDHERALIHNYAGHYWWSMRVGQFVDALGWGPATF